MILPKILCVIAVVFSVAVVLSVAATETEAQNCIIGSAIKTHDCQICICTGGTTHNLCTKGGCDKDEEPSNVVLRRLAPRERRQAECTPGERKALDCNQCRCVRGGAWACTRRACVAPRRQQYKREVPVAADLRTTPCAPTDYFKIDCNTCYCKDDGTGYICTENFCAVYGAADLGVTENAGERVGKAHPVLESTTEQKGDVSTEADD